MAGEAQLKVILSVADNASKQLKGLMGTLDQHSKQLKIAGAAATGFGIAIVGALGMATKAAAEEEAGIAKLSTAMTNAGVAYADVRGELEAVIDATQQKTSVADDQQRAALAALIGVTSDYGRSLELLPLAMDLAAAKGMDLASAAEVVGRVSEGNTTILMRYGVQLKEGATATEALGALTAKFGGQAEAFGKTAAGQMQLVKNNLGDAMESIGAVFIPMLVSFAKHLSTVVQWFKNLSPETQRFIAIGLALAAAMLLVVGPLLLILGMLPAIIAGVGMLGTAITIATGPVGLISLAILALIAAGVLLVKNWDTIVEAAERAWAAITGTAYAAVNGLIGFAEAYANAWVTAANQIIRALNSIRVSIPDWVPGFGGKTFGISLPEVPRLALPRLAEGGLVTRPTLAMLGEHGPEAVLPLGRGTTGITIIFNGPIYNMDDFRRRVAQAWVEAQRGGAFYGLPAGG